MSVRTALRAAVAGLAALVTATLVTIGFTASPAAAHNALVASAPKDGAVLRTAPATVELEFTEVVNDRFARVAVTDPAGNVLSAAPARVEGTTVTQPLTLPGPGRYRVGFRVVSTDGHPVEGSMSFTVRSTGSAGPDASPSRRGGGADRTDPGGPAGWAPVAGLFAVLVLAAGGLLVATRRRTNLEEPGDGDASG